MYVAKFMWKHNFIVPPKFVQTPQNNHFKREEIYIGDINHPTCVLCVNCTVTGAPAPVVTWEYLHGSMSEFIPIITNQSNASSPYYVQDNGQVCIIFIVSTTILIVYFTELMFQ